jgi:hypothetical protein
MSPLRGLNDAYPLIFYNHFNPLGLKIQPLIHIRKKYKVKSLPISLSDSLFPARPVRRAYSIF